MSDNESLLSLPYRTLSLGEKLVTLGFISEEQLDLAVSQFENLNDGKALGSRLVEMGFITEKILINVLSRVTDIDDLDIKTTIFDPDILKKVPKELAIKSIAIPIAIIENKLFIAISKDTEPDIEIIDQISSCFDNKYSVISVFALAEDILSAINAYYEYDMSIAGVLRELEHGNHTTFEDPSLISNAVVRLVNAVFLDAVKKGASDIHWEPENSIIRLRYRIDGYLRQRCSFSNDFWDQVLIRLKILADFDRLENKLSQQGHISCNILGYQRHLRIATQPTIYGESVVLHLANYNKMVIPFPSLGFSKYNESLIKNLLLKPHGMIIIAGPTGSGKTTTAYSLLKHLTSSTVKVLSIDNPVEFTLPLMQQFDHSGTIDKISLNDVMNSVVKQDPDVIFINEIRDLDSANAAFRAAITGHKVITTLNAKNALSAILRLVYIGIPPFLLSNCISCVIAQHLMRKLCNNCKSIDITSIQEANILGSKSKTDIYRRNGCEQCDYIGYKGREAICEVFCFDEEICELVGSNATLQQLVEHLNQQGNSSLIQEARNKINSGISDIDEMMRVVDVTQFLK